MIYRASAGICSLYWNSTLTYSRSALSLVHRSYKYARDEKTSSSKQSRGRRTDYNLPRGVICRAMYTPGSNDVYASCAPKHVVYRSYITNVNTSHDASHRVGHTGMGGNVPRRVTCERTCAEVPPRREK